IGRTDVTYVSAALFDWRPDRSYDVVFFSFWLSHVPRSRFGAFWSLVRSCLVPSGRAFLIDNRNDPTPGRKVKDPRRVRPRSTPASPQRRLAVPGRQGDVRARRGPVNYRG